MVRRPFAAFLTAMLLLVVGQDLVSAQNIVFEMTTLYINRGDNRREFDYFEGAARMDPSADHSFPDSWGHRFRVGYETYGFTIDAIYSRTEPWVSTDADVVGTLSLDFDGQGAQTPLALVSAVQQAATFDEQPVPVILDQGEDERLLNTNFDTIYRSEWDDAELNFRAVLPFAPWITYGMGARYGTLDEFFNLSIFGTFDEANSAEVLPIEQLTHAALTTDLVNPAGNTNTGVVGGGMTLISGAPDGFVGDFAAVPVTPSEIDWDFDADVVNTLIGAQMVMHALFYEGDYVIIEGYTKGGVFYNHIRATLTEQIAETNNGLSVYQRVHRDQKSAVAFLGNIYLGGALKLRENIRVKAGYELQFISGMALAADQWAHVQADNFGNMRYEIDASGTIINRGGTCSLEVIW